MTQYLKIEKEEIKRLFLFLCRQPIIPFPGKREHLNAPKKHGVYIIGHQKKVVQVGRTYHRREGLYARLNDHLHGRSSFAINYFEESGKTIRDGFTYQFLKVRASRKRALLEALATGLLCPEYLGLGKKKT